jgi:16S rRNA (uracil1498-N3)-methyltransferase
MSEPYFYYADLATAGEQVVLTGDEAQHAAGARRLRAGDVLVLFDGKGITARATLLALRDRGRTLDLKLGERATHSPPSPVVHLACALPKGDRLATLLDGATQLGMTSFTPLHCAHSVVPPTAANVARLHRLCLEACKQSHRAWLPQIREPATVAALVVQPRAANERLLLAHPGGQPWPALAPPLSHTLTILIGPEGGFSDPEVADARDGGAAIVDLGGTLLRVETAAQTLLALAKLARAP